MKNKPAKVAIRASTQDHLDIADIRDDIVILKDGGACVVISTTAVNFGLLSESEQDAIIYSYAGLLNSLTFSTQIIIRSKKMDITSYLELLKQQEQAQTSDVLKTHMSKYREFVGSIIQENKVLDKGFYVVIPFSPLEMGVKSGTKSLFGGFGKKTLPFSEDYILEKAKVSLIPKRDNMIRLLSRMGLKAQPLTTTELIKLFYEIYNPEEDIGQRIVATEDYETPLVAPVVELPLPKPGTPPPQHRPQPQQRPHGPMRTPQHVQAAHVSANIPTSGQPQPQRQPARPAQQQAPAKPVSMQDVQSVLSKLEGEMSKMGKGT